MSTMTMQDHGAQLRRVGTLRTHTDRGSTAVAEVWRGDGRYALVRHGAVIESGGSGPGRWDQVRVQMVADHA